MIATLFCLVVWIAALWLSIKENSILGIICDGLIVVSFWVDFKNGLETEISQVIIAIIALICLFCHYYEKKELH